MWRVEEGQRDGSVREISLVDGVYSLEENGSYQIHIASAEDARLFLGERPLPRLSPGVFGLDIGYWAGANTLHLQLPHGERVSRALRVVPRPEKLSPEAWGAMLSDLEAWVPGLSVGSLGGLSGKVGRAGVSLSFLAVALLPLVPLLVRVGEAIARDPKSLSLRRSEEVPLHQARTANREALRWISSRPQTWQALQEGERGAEWVIPQPRVHETTDHPANRYAKWLLLRVAERLGSLGEKLRASGERLRKSASIDDGGAWCVARGEEAQRAAESLFALSRRSGFRAVRPAPASEDALLSLQDQPLYARLHSIGRRFLSPLFSRDEDEDPKAPTRPSYNLFELWVFLLVWKTLQEELLGFSWQYPADCGPRLLSGRGEGLSLSARGPGGDFVLLSYNPTFSSWYRQRGGRYSLSKERRPDVTLAWLIEGRRGWAFLDAKYRVSRPMLGDAFESLHIYRDSLRWESFGGASRGGVLLAPDRSEGAAAWFEPAYLRRFGIGVVRACPGEPIPTALREWLWTLLFAV
jgi:hypothetical protein